MFEIEILIDGKQAAPDGNHHRSVEEAAKTLAARYGDQAAAWSCLKHGAAPQIRVEGQRLERLSVVVAGCCASFTQQVAESLNLL